MHSLGHVRQAVSFCRCSALTALLSFSQISPVCVVFAVVAYFIGAASAEEAEKLGTVIGIVR